MSRVAATALGVLGGNALTAGLGAAWQTVSSGIFDLNSQLQGSQIAFATMLHSASAAQTLVGQLADFAKTTPFDFPQVVSAAQRLLAFGFSAQDVIPMLTRLGDVAAGLNLGPEGVSHMTMVLGQMRVAGRVLQQDLNQLQSAGVDTNAVFAIMAQQTGTTVTALKALQSAGKLDSGLFLTAFMEFSRRNFGGLMEAQSHTLIGALSNIRDALGMAGARGFRPLFDFVQSRAGAFADFLSTDAFAAFVTQVQALVAQAIPPLQAALDWLIGNGPKAWTWLTQAGAAVQQFAAPLLGFLTGAGGAFLAITAVAAGLGAVGAALAFLLSPIGLLVIAAGLLGAAWATNFGDIQGKTAAAWAFLQPILTDLWAWLGTTIPAALTALAGFWTGTLQPALESVWGFISTNLLPIFQGLANVGLAVLGQEVAALAAVWTNVLQPALATVAAFLSGTVLPVLQTVWNWFATKLAPVFASISAAVKSVGGAAPSWLNSLATSVTALPVGALPTPGNLVAAGGRTVDNSLSIQFTGPVNASTPEDRAALAQEIARARDQAASADAGAGMPEGA